LQVAVDVTNTGRREGKEVVQLYLKELVSNYSEDYGFMLKRFQKINLLPGINKYHTNRSGKKNKVTIILYYSYPGQTQTVFFELNGDDLVYIGDFNQKAIVETVIRVMHNKRISFFKTLSWMKKFIQT
jgi:hypothetical protein